MSKVKGTFWVLLFALLGLALYQIVLIFWEAPAQRENGVWYSVAQPDPEANLLRPEEIFFTLGGEDGGYGRIAKQDESFEDVFSSAYELLTYVLKNSELETDSFEALPWSREVCIFNYGFALQTDLILQQIGLEKKVAEGSWSEIWIVPAQNRQEKTGIYILDRDSDICLRAECSAWDQEQNHFLMERLRNLESLLSKSYFAVKSAWPKAELHGDYLLEEAMRETVSTIRADAIFLVGKKMNPLQAERYALRFFQYPDTVKVKESTEQILFTNEKITVKVDDTGLLQYVETLTEEEKKPITMKEAYQLAVGFVKADLDWEGTAGLDFSLSGYEIIEGQYVFYFNYLVGDIPYRMDEERSELWRMEYPIRVTVEGSRVRRYERYALDFEVDMANQHTLGHTWQNVMNDMAEQGMKLKGVPVLKYYYERSQMVLYWEAETEQGLHRIRAY